MTDSKPSKTERKRRQTALQQLGEQLIDLEDELLASLQLDERLLVAIADARKMKSREALRRHKQYIGKLMRDADQEPIEALFAGIRADDRRQKRVFAEAERWRDRLVRERYDGLLAFETDTGRTDARLAQLLEDLDRAVSDRAEKTATREIFRVLHAALAARTRDG